MSADLRDIGEFGLIKRLTAGAVLRLPHGVVGPGDDSAVLPLAAGQHGWQLLTTDSMVEGRHFRFGFSSGFDVGWKALSTSVSDIAAMGGAPAAAVVALHVPVEFPLGVLDDLYRGLYAASDAFVAPLVGGDVTASQQLVVNVTVLGFSASEPILRSTAQEGDDIWVSGKIGEAGAGLAILSGKIPETAFNDRGEYLIQRHRRPEARTELGQLLAREKLAHAMIDVSDGLIQDLAHIAELSKVCCELDEAAIPSVGGLSDGVYSLADALSAGDDYELLFTAPKSASERIRSLSGVSRAGASLPCLTCIGFVRAQAEGDEDFVYLRSKTGEVLASELFLNARGAVRRRGYDHFWVSPEGEYKS